MHEKWQDKIIICFASAFYSGSSPFASGTVATIFPAIPLYLLISGTPVFLYGAITVMVTLASVWLSGHGERIWGKKDPGRITIDEVAGFLVAMFAFQPSFKIVIVGFFLFRLFDVVKPFPARWFEKNLPGGWGVTMDDIGAGLWTQLLLRVGIYFGLLN